MGTNIISKSDFLNFLEAGEILLEQFVGGYKLQLVFKFFLICYLFY